ncbi:MAG: 5-(carboxyamino)imidazole ribonucleotide mutase [Vicinamibacteria bacterium]|nr:5-(carboxyamino)imidazole ribonucleotide mutase [Vicinamibacteria bacterium]
MARSRPKVAVLMGSESDLPVVAKCLRTLDQYGLRYDVRVLSAHRSPEQTARFARGAERRGYLVLIAAAGGAAHLAGALAAYSTLPVIGIPIVSSPLLGLDALLSTVQMPPGVPVATVGVGDMGAANAGHLAAVILALGDARLRRRLRDRRRRLARDILKKNRRLSPDAEPFRKRGRMDVKKR